MRKRAPGYLRSRRDFFSALMRRERWSLHHVAYRESSLSLKRGVVLANRRNVTVNPTHQSRERELRATLGGFERSISGYSILGEEK